MCWRERIGARPYPDRPRAGADLIQNSPSKAGSSQDDSVDAEAEAVFGVRKGQGDQALHPCWQPATLPSGLQIFENRFTGTVSKFHKAAHAKAHDICHADAWPALLLDMNLQSRRHNVSCALTLGPAHMQFSSPYMTLQPS